MQVLLRMFQDEDYRVHSNAALALVKLGKPSAEIAVAVAQSIEQHQDSKDIGYAIDTLWDLISADTSV